MNSNPILEELWRVKDDLAAEAGYDPDRFVENLRRWEAENLPDRPIKPTAASQEVKDDASSLVLREEPPTGGGAK